MEHRTFIQLTGILICLSVVTAAFHGSQKRVEAIINNAFKEAIEQDYQHRKSYLTRHASTPLHHEVKDYALAPSVNRNIKSYSVKTRKGTTIYRFKQGLDEKKAKRLLNQHLLEQAHPLRPKLLKAMFQECLFQKGIDANVGILCLRNQTSQWSEADSIVPANAYSTPRQTLDITGKLKVQAWVDYNWTTLFKHLDPVFYVFLIFIAGMLMWIWPTKKKKQEVTKEPQDFQIDMDKLELTIGGTSCTIAKLDLTILQMLHNHHGNCVTREEIKQQFWPTDENAGEKIDTHIKNIRKTLKDFPQYRIVTVRGKGYYLQTVL